MLPIEIDEGSKRDLPRSLGVQFPQDHLHLLLAQALLQFCGQVQQVVLADESLTVCVDLPEHSFQVFAGVPFVGPFEDHPQKFLEVNVAAFVLVVEGHGLVYSVPFGMIAVVLGHRLQQVPGGEDPVLVSIERVEDFFPDLDVALCHVVRDELSGLEGLPAGGVAHARGVHRVPQPGVHHEFNQLLSYLQIVWKRHQAGNQAEKKCLLFWPNPTKTIPQIQLIKTVEQFPNRIFRIFPPSVAQMRPYGPN